MRTGAEGAHRWGLLAGAGAIIVAGLVIASLTRPRTSSCEHDVKFADHHAALERCLANFHATGDERELLWAARDYVYMGDFAHAGELAHQLIRGALAGDGHGILAYLALHDGALAAAGAQVAFARVAHARAADQRGL